MFEFLESVSGGVLAVGGAAALAGLLVGAMSGAKTDLVLTSLAAVIMGLSVSVVLRLLGVDPLLDVDGYSLIYAAGSGAVTAFIVAKGS